jgi:L,D-peptidoglycan transpeptidase YkuD (ErfK/YbiS/YcfS/YnhG family)|tara:strand:- start:770 stop:1261 length:492 start_codon:yes stop_codon:yes gene_type:complete
MLIKLKNKDTLKLDDHILTCTIGKNGISSRKKEGDKCTPRGVFSFGKLYYRADRVKKPKTKISTRIIKKDMGWCNDITSKFYNKEIKVNKKIKHEKLFRKDNLYNFLVIINYNTQNIKVGIGSAIFLHLTNNYKKTAGCVAIREKDFLIILKLINKKSKIIIY